MCSIIQQGLIVNNYELFAKTNQQHSHAVNVNGMIWCLPYPQIEWNLRNVSKRVWSCWENVRCITLSTWLTWMNGFGWFGFAGYYLCQLVYVTNSKQAHGNDFYNLMVYNCYRNALYIQKKFNDDMRIDCRVNGAVAMGLSFANRCGSDIKLLLMYFSGRNPLPESIYIQAFSWRTDSVCLHWLHLFNQPIAFNPMLENETPRWHIIKMHNAFKKDEAQR